MWMSNHKTHDCKNHLLNISVSLIPDTINIKYCSNGFLYRCRVKTWDANTAVNISCFTVVNSKSRHRDNGTEHHFHQTKQTVQNWPYQCQLKHHYQMACGNLTLVLNMPCLCKQCRSDQLASSEANWSGSALFVIQYVNLYQLTEVGVAS